MGSTERLIATPDERNTSERLALRSISSALGVEVVGFDVNALGSPPLGAFLHRALLDHQLVLLRGLELDVLSFRKIGLGLGPLRPVPSGMTLEAGTTDIERIADSRDVYTLHWHADGSAERLPARYTSLYAVRVPSAGGETSFADMYAACAALSPEQRQAVAGRRAIHDPKLSRHFRHGRPIAPAGTSLRRSARLHIGFIRRMLSRQIARHPVIRVHEETGRSALFLGDHAWRIAGYTWPFGARLVDELNAFATTHPEWTYTHSWRAGDLVIWDNRCLLHRRSRYDPARGERIMLRAVVQGAPSAVSAPAIE